MTQQSQSGLTMPLSRHSVGTYPETSSCNLSRNIWLQSSQLTEPLWTDPGLKSGIGVCMLISTENNNNNKNAQVGNECLYILPKSSQVRKKPPPPPPKVKFTLMFHQQFLYILFMNSVDQIQVALLRQGYITLKSSASQCYQWMQFFSD